MLKNSIYILTLFHFFPQNVKVGWDTGRRIVELGVLAQGLAACTDCGHILNLANTTGNWNFSKQVISVATNIMLNAMLRNLS